MKTLIVEIKDKSKNDFVLELLASFSFIKVTDKKEFKNSDKKLVKKYKKSFNETVDNATGKQQPQAITDGINSL